MHRVRLSLSLLLVLLVLQPAEAQKGRARSRNVGIGTLAGNPLVHQELKLGDEQKATLVKMAEARFAGMTVFEAEEPRLHYPPEARDNRQGGIWLVVEFNGDDVGEVADKKASLDLWMTEAYDLFFNSGCDELTQVDLSGYGEALGRPPIGPTVISDAIVFKTRMKKVEADTVDWAKKDTLDFEEIWDVQLINVRWRRELLGLPLD